MSPLTTSNSVIEIAWETARAPGAVAIARLRAPDGAALDALLHTLTGQHSPRIGQFSHANLGSVNLTAIDDGLVVRLTSESALIMPHGGPRIVAQLDSWMRAHGVTGKNHGEPSPADDASDALRTYPEAQCFREALALATASTAASARAIPLLLAQPARISTALAGGFSHDARSVERSQRLARLLHPPRVVAVGAANVGKSSLLNALAGRTVAIAMDFAGTTRDAVAARVELDGLVVDWFDTPGIRCSADEVERAAQALAETLRVGAALLIEICAPGVPSPEIVSDVARLRVCTRIDLDRRCQSVQARTAAVQVSATERIGLNELAGAIRRRLVFDEDLASTEPWIFHSAAL